MLQRILKSVFILAAFATFAGATASALLADCVTASYDPNEEVCTSCGESTCCSTHWHGGNLISSWCFWFS